MGERYVKVVALAREGAQARVVAAAMEEITDRSEAGRAEAVGRALRAAGIRERRVVVDVGRADAVVKRIAIPATDRKTARNVLEFEAQQHVPFPMEEMVWDFELEAGGQVLLAAARRSSVEAVRGIMAQAGLRVTAVTVSSAAATATYLEGTEDLVGPSDGAAVLIEIGAGPVVVNVLRDGKWLLSRPLSISGDDLTAAFAADLCCDLEQARATQRTQGFAALPEARPQVTTWLRELRAQVERSLMAAAEQTDAVAVERILGTGGGWLTPGLAAAVAQSLGGTVQIFPRGEAVTAAYGAAIGLALQGLGLVRGIDLTAGAIEETRRQSRRSVRSAVAVVGVLATLIVGWWGYTTLARHAATSQATRASVERQDKELQTLRTRQRAVDAQVAQIERLLAPRHRVLEALRELSNSAPRGIWLTSISYSPGRPVAVQGRAQSAAQVTSLLESLGTRAALVHMKQGEREVEFAINMPTEEDR
jgi:type IV pilus assembly protein PilM